MRLSTFISAMLRSAIGVLGAMLMVLLAIFPARANGTPPPVPAKDQISIDLSGPVGVIDLTDLLAPYDAPGTQSDGASRWYLIPVTNGSVRPVTRVLQAEDAPNAALHIFPRRARSQILQVASSDSRVAAEPLAGLGRHAYLVQVPAATSASLAIRVANADAKPSVLAWNEPSLVARERQRAVFLAAVAGLIAAAAMIMVGVAVIAAHPAPGWAAVVLGFIFLIELQGAEVLDSRWTTAVGGPYGLGAMLAGCALAAAIRLANLVTASSGTDLPGSRRREWLAYAILAVSVAALLGVPGATVATDSLVVCGAVLIAGYLVAQGLRESRAARVLAPSAVIFAVVAITAALISFGVLQQSLVIVAMVAGLSATGAVLLALAVAASKAIAVLPVSRNRESGSDAVPSPTIGADRAGEAIAAARQGIFDLDLNRSQLRLSRDASRIAGVRQAKLLPHDEWKAHIHPEDRQVYDDALNEYRGHPGLAFRMEFRADVEGRKNIWLELRASILDARGRKAARCLGLISDITSRKEAEPALPGRALADALTGLGNRISLIAELEKTGGGWNEMAFAVLDIDRFKAIHASLGDAGGDQLLISFAARLTARFSQDTKVFRTGGDSFALIVPGAAQYMSRLGSELIDLGTAPFSIEGRNIFASASAGVVVADQAEDPLELIRHAELALAVAKRQGGGCWKLFSPDMEELVRGDAVALETELRRGLSENQFSMHYQPVVRLKDGSVAGFEALIRWQHPEKGLISPAEFIAHSEETGLIVSLGRFALSRVASDFSDWQRYFPIEPPLFVSVNVSRRQLQQEDFAGSIEALLAAGHFPERTFHLELTESAIQLQAEGRRTLESLRRAGAGLALDDFGTGLSSLSELKDLPFDTLKVDRSFLTERGGTKQEADATAVLTSILSLARQLGRKVIVEGVETERDAIWLESIGCEFAQGYYFSPPLPPDEAVKFIASHMQLGGGGSSEAESDITSGAAGMRREAGNIDA